MKTKFFTVLSVLLLSGGLLLCTPAFAQRNTGGTESGSRPGQQQTGTSSAASASRTQQGAAGSTVATAVTQEEAAKKYPPPSSGKYPMGERDPHKASGIVISPYPPHTEYDCSQIAHGGLVLDTHVNKVFVRP